MLRFVHLWLLPVIALLSACSPQARRADLVFLNGAEPESLDPAVITGQPEGRLANALFEGLTANNAAGEAVPGVAERWDISPDGRTYIFHLRSSARWSNGEPVVAEDFVRSWQRTLAPETASEYAYQLYYIKNGKPYNEGKLSDFSQVGVRSLDAHLLEVTLENPTPYFVDLCAFTTLLPVHVKTIEREGDDWTKPGKLVCNGAYRLSSWRINDRIRLEKNPFYWNSNSVRLAAIDVLPISKPNTAYNFYASGQADLIMDKGLVPTALMGELRKRPDFHSAPFLGTYFLRFNCTKPPFNDARVRLAFSMVLDKERIVQKITRAGELPASGIVPPGMNDYRSIAGLSKDCQRAQELLAEAGFAGGKGFPLVNYLYSEGQLNEDIAVEIQAMFRDALGITINLHRQEWKVYLRSMSNLDYDICRASWVGDYKDPNTFLDMFVTGGGNNRTGWSNKRYDELIAAAAMEMDAAKRLELLAQSEELLIVHEAPICPIYYYVGIQIYDANKLGGIEANLLDEHPLKAIYRKD